MGTITDKLTYLNTTKIKLRDSLNKFGSSILSTDTFRSYDTKLNDIYNKLPKITQSGTGFTLENVQNGQVDDFKMIATDLYQNQLPSEYTAVEYLQSDNECYIDTGINADYKLSLKLKTACLNSTQQHMGAINNTGSSYIRHHITFNPSQPQDIGIYIGQTNNQLSLKSFDNNFHEFNLDIYNKKVSIDNDSPISISYNNFDVGINYYLFARNGSNIYISKGSYKIAYCKMYYQDNLVRDFAPCYRNSDNVAGLYDFVTNTFFTNQGTGTFTVGNNITLPNPDYPQEIKVVEGRQVITDKGKNLLNKNLIDLGYAYTYGTTGEVPHANANNTRATISPTNAILVEPNTSYTINHDSTWRIAIAEMKNDLESLGDTGWLTYNQMPYTITTKATTKYLAFNLSKADNTAITNEEFQTFLNSNIIICQGTSINNYEPYYEPVSYNIDLHGKNEFDGEYEDGYYNMNGTKSSTQDPYGRRSTNLNKIEPNTNYSISINNNIISETIRLFYYDANRGFISTESISNGTFTTPAECYYVSWHSSSLKQNYPDGIPNMMIEQGQTVTTYEDYYDYKLAKMPNTDYKNRVYKNNGNWYFEKSVEKYLLDGTRNWRKYTSGNYTVFYIENNGATTGSSSSNPVLSDKFKSKFEIGNDNIFLSSSGNRISISTTIANSLEDWNAWLSIYNVIVYYALATPVTTQITNTTLINQLEAISVHTGTNIIELSSDNNMTPQIEITRLKELERLT